MDKTKIQWTDATWNPVRGCSRVSAGCMNCYAEKVASRFSWAGHEHHAGGSDMEEKAPGPYSGLVDHRGHWTGAIRFVEEHLLDPIRWKKPRKIFVNSMSDLFHKNVPDEWIDKIFAVMALAPQHTFQVLTKRPERMREYLCKLSDVGPFAAQLRIDRCAAKINGGSFVGSGWPLKNVWLGVSVENQETADERIPLLLETPAAVRFVSYEPALDFVDFTRMGGDDELGTEYNSLTGEWEGNDEGGTRLDWIIVGGESGPGARRFDPAWARSVVHQCEAAGVPVFVKQMGSNAVEAELSWPVHAHWTNDLNRKGDDPGQWPEELRVRQFPHW